MANYTKKGDKMPKGKPFVPGDPRAGRPKDPPELKQIKRLTKGEFSLLIQKYMTMDLMELGAIANNPTTKAIDAMIASIIVQCIKQGDYTRLNFFIDREFGKVTEKVEVKNYKDMTDEELILEAENEVRKLKEKLKGE